MSSHGEGEQAQESRCIYCLDTKAISEFDRDHVIPQAFGTFEPDNLVVRCVCRCCNGELGRTIEQKMCRDTIEGLDRVRHGMKKPADWKTLGKASTLRVEFDRNGPLKGAYGYHVPDPSGNGLAVTPAAIIGLGRCADGPFEWFGIDELPAKARLYELGFERGTHVYLQFWGAPLSDIRRSLETKGYAIDTVTETPPPQGPTRVEVVSRIGEPEFRVAAKIALNYVAATAGANYALMPNFNAARRFVRFGAATERASVSLAPPLCVVRANRAVTAAHYVSVHYVRGLTIAQVSLFCRLRYVVRLSNDPFILPVLWESAHVFDLETRRVEQVPPPPLP